MGGVGHSRPINETMLVCRVIWNVHTVVVCTGVWLVESMSWLCILMGVHIVRPIKKVIAKATLRIASLIAKEWQQYLTWAVIGIICIA